VEAMMLPVWHISTLVCGIKTFDCNVENINKTIAMDKEDNVAKLLL
jgi:hypothetical protein